MLFLVPPNKTSFFRLLYSVLFTFARKNENCVVNEQNKNRCLRRAAKEFSQKKYESKNNNTSALFLHC